MYEAYFHLHKRPFSATPDPTCFFAPAPIQEVLDELVLRAEGGQGIAILTAPAGTGKTLVCRRIAAELSAQWTTVFLPNASFPTRRALLQAILFELDQPYSGLEEQELRLAVFSALRDLSRSGRGTILIVDEAHLLSERLLEELRMIASLADADQPLARIILAGQPALEERLTDRALEALNQRIICQAYLEPLTQRESIDYIRFRIEWAGGRSSDIFTPAALERIAAASGGLARCINQLCDHALLLTFVQEKPQVLPETVAEALRDLKQLPQHWNLPVTADVGLDDIEEQPETATSGIDGDDAQGQTPFASESTTATGESVYIEIGEGAEGPDSLAVAADNGGTAADSPKSRTAPWAGSEPGRSERSSDVRERRIAPFPGQSRSTEYRFVEEAVDDRYAALDRHPSGIARTFDDVATMANWSTRRQPNAPPPPAPPVTPAPPRESAEITPTNEVQRPDHAIDGLVPLIDDVLSDNYFADDQADHELLPNLDAEPQLADEIRPETRAIEEQIGEGVLDACLEVQAAIGRDCGPTECDAEAVDVQEESSGEDPIESEPADEFDVIEPEPRAPRWENVDRAREIPAAGRSGEVRDPAQPKYRHIFSTLRRRARRGQG